MKIKLLTLVLVPLLFLGCNDLFDSGDWDKTWDGQELGFFPLNQEISIEDGEATVEVQLIAEHQSSDVDISFSTSGDAEEGVHYEIVTQSPTISAGESTVDIVIDLMEDSLDEGESVTLTLLLSDSGDIIASENLKEANITLVE